MAAKATERRKHGKTNVPSANSSTAVDLACTARTDWYGFCNIQMASMASNGRCRLARSIPGKFVGVDVEPDLVSIPKLEDLCQQ